MNQTNVITPPTRQQAFYGLGVLAVINLLNYIDRYILAGVMTRVQEHFGLNDAQGGLLAMTFLLVYTFASPVGGFLGDRVPRRILLSVAVLIWSAATVLSGLATSFVMLLAARAATGFGEAGYATIAPSFIADLFPKSERSKMLSLFYVAMPLGAAIGFMVGGHIGSKYGWHTAFFVGGAPGLVLALMAFMLKEPARGAMDDEKPEAPVSFTTGLRNLIRNVRFWIVTGGLTFMTFSVGGLSIWMPKFLETKRGFSPTEAAMYLGATTVLGGLGGTICGGIIGDRLEQRRSGSSIWMSGVGLVVAAPLMAMVALTDNRALVLAGLFLSQFFIFLNNGPLNAAIVNVVSPQFRAFAFSVATLTLHLLGDASSPVVIGAISDASSLDVAILVNAVPVLLGGLLLIYGARKYWS